MNWQGSYPTTTAVAAVFGFLAPVAAWLYSELRGRWRDRLKADFELLKLCRDAEAAGSELAAVRNQIEDSIRRRGALFREHKRYDWTYAGMAAVGVALATAATVSSWPWLSVPIRGFVLGCSALLVLGSVLNFFGGEPR